jgi:antitoxin HigA-1
MDTITINIGMKPLHPSDIIRTEILDELGLTVSKAAEVLQVRRATLSDLVNGKAGVLPEMALRIEKAFGMNMDTLLKMQTWFDTYTMREQSDQIKVKPIVPVEYG